MNPVGSGISPVATAQQRPYSTAMGHFLLNLLRQANNLSMDLTSPRFQSEVSRTFCVCSSSRQVLLDQYELIGCFNERWCYSIKNRTVEPLMLRANPEKMLELLPVYAIEGALAGIRGAALVLENSRGIQMLSLMEGLALLSRQYAETGGFFPVIDLKMLRNNPMYPLIPLHRFDPRNLQELDQPVRYNLMKTVVKKLGWAMQSEVAA